MEVDPLDPTISIHGEKTIVVACADPEYRKLLMSLAKFSRIFDVYRDPDRLLPILFEIPCFFRLFDYTAYKAIEAEFISYLSVQDPRQLIPSVVYGVEGRPMFESIALIDGHATHPAMLGSYFIDCRKGVNYS